MKKDPKIFLRHILDSIGEIENYTRRLSKGDFLKDTKTQDAIVRRIEIIGEAAKNLPPDFKKQHSEVKWAEIAGMRDVLIHEYFGVNLSLVWETVKRDVPDLKKQILRLI